MATEEDRTGALSVRIKFQSFGAMPKKALSHVATHLISEAGPWKMAIV